MYSNQIWLCFILNKKTLFVTFAEFTMKFETYCKISSQIFLTMNYSKTRFIKIDLQTIVLRKVKPLKIIEFFYFQV